MAVENIEKEPVREYNKEIDKQKANNRFEENKTIRKIKIEEIIITEILMKEN